MQPSPYAGNPLYPGNNNSSKIVNFTGTTDYDLFINFENLFGTLYGKFNLNKIKMIISQVGQAHNFYMVTMVY